MSFSEPRWSVSSCFVAAAIRGSTDPMTSRIWRYALLAMAVTSLTGFSLIVAGGHSLSVHLCRFDPSPCPLPPIRVGVGTATCAVWFVGVVSGRRLPEAFASFNRSWCRYQAGSSGSRAFDRICCRSEPGFRPENDHNSRSTQGAPVLGPEHDHNYG